MTEVVSVKFKNRGKTYYFAAAGNTVETGQNVIVETSKGLEFAQCVMGNHYVPDEKVIPPIRPVVRVATENDLRVAEINKKREREAFDICKKKIEDHGLDMKLVDVECSFEGNKITFFFTSDGRVDFRELVKDLASVFRNRIELRQIGVRDEAKMLGGIGICRAALLLQPVPGRVPARLHQDGQDTVHVPQPEQDLRHLRQAHVLPEVRGGGL